MSGLFRPVIVSITAFAGAIIAFFFTNIFIMGKNWHIGFDSANPFGFLLDFIHLATIYALAPIIGMSCLSIFSPRRISLYACITISVIFLIPICAWKISEARSFYGGGFSWWAFQRNFLEILPGISFCAVIFAITFRKLMPTKMSSENASIAN